MRREEESGIRFDYDENACRCIKFDDDVAYRSVERHLKPTKGVDFIYMSDDKLVFVEVKNFIGHTHKPETKERLDENGDHLMTEIALKVKDTLACALSAARFSTNDHEFWHSFNRYFIDEKKKVLVIAWIEFDARNEKERRAKMDAWNRKLKQKLHWIHSVKVSVNSVQVPPPVDIIQGTYAT